MLLPKLATHVSFGAAHVRNKARPKAGPVGQQDHQIMLLKAIIVVVAHNMAIFSPVAFQEETHCEAVLFLVGLSQACPILIQDLI